MIGIIGRVTAMLVTTFAFGLFVASSQETGEDTTLQTVEHETLGAYLTDAEGQALYLRLPDKSEGETVSESTCTGRCATTWPAFTTTSASVEGAAYGEGVDASLVGTLEREEGTLQVTYNGWPLYTFSRDLPNVTAGQGAGEVWYLVSPEGRPLGAGEEEAEVAEGEGAEGAPIDHMVLGALMGEGREVYVNNCTVCHGQQGEGGQGPELAGDDVLSDKRHVINQILRGSRFMPRFGDQLSDREVAAVATFVRNSWGNEFGAVVEEEVSSAR